MADLKFSLPRNSLRFNELGEVEILNQDFAKAIADLSSKADIVSCTTNNGCGNDVEVNGQGCGKANIKCSSSIVQMDQIEIIKGGGRDPMGSPVDIVRFKSYELGKAILNSKLTGAQSLGVAITGLKGF